MRMIRVLLADDESIFLEFMQSIIDWKSFGCEICAAVKDGKSALEAIRTFQPEIAFIDINMPIMNGIELCRAVREQNAEVKLILVTGHDEFSFAYQAIKIGINDYLLKPFSGEELEEALKKAIGGLANGAESDEDKKIGHLEEGKTKYEIMAYKIDEYLNENYRRRSLGLAEIAAAMGFENSYLRRVYKTATGITIMQKLEEIRISRAKQYLESGKYQNQEISEMVGFSDQYYFSRRFKQLCGVSPSEYRKNKIS